MIHSLLHNIRFYVLSFSIILAVTIFAGVVIFIPEQRLQISRLTQLYALTAVVYLYLAIIASPLFHVFPNLSFKAKYTKARRGIGVSAFIFAFLHACFAFFGQLGGFSGLPFLSSNYLLAITLSFIALQILFLMAITSVDKIIARMTFPRWKKLHRFIYLAGMLILIHALMLGSHFIDISTIIPQLFFIAITILLILESIRIDHYLSDRYDLPRLGIPQGVVILAVSLLIVIAKTSPTNNVLYNIHAEHIKLAQESQQTSQTTISNIPGLTGDKTKRYTVSFSHPEIVNPTQDVQLRFKVFDASNGEEVTLFNTLYEKKVHMIVVDQTLTYFNHIHPTQNESEFTIITQFPQNGMYHIYLDFQPFGAIEQQFAFTLPVGDPSMMDIPEQKVDTVLKKSFNEYAVELSFSQPLEAKKVSVGQQELTFTLTDATTKKPLINLKPYLASFGHLAMINQKTFEYVHVHPSALRPPQQDAVGGPTVKFLPLGLYGPIKPGIYRMFAQFNPDGNLFTSDFTVEIQ